MMGISQLGFITSFLEPLLVRSPDQDVSQNEIINDINNLMYIGK